MSKTHPLEEMVAHLRERSAACLPEVFGADVALLDWMSSRIREAEGDGMAEGDGKFRDAVREMTLHLRSVSKRMDDALHFPRPEKEPEPLELAEYDPAEEILRAVETRAELLEEEDEEISALITEKAMEMVAERREMYRLALPSPEAAAGAPNEGPKKKSG